MLCGCCTYKQTDTAGARHVESGGQTVTSLTLGLRKLWTETGRLETRLENLVSFHLSRLGLGLGLQACHTEQTRASVRLHYSITIVVFIYLSTNSHGGAHTHAHFVINKHEVRVHEDICGQSKPLQFQRLSAPVQS